jgi:hypothetical protein
MTKLRVHSFTISVDGYGAGPDLGVLKGAVSKVLVACLCWLCPRGDWCTVQSPTKKRMGFAVIWKFFG